MKRKSIRVDELISAAAKERLAAAGWNDIDYSSLRVRARAERAREWVRSTGMQWYNFERR